MRQALAAADSATALYFYWLLLGYCLRCSLFVRKSGALNSAMGFQKCVDEVLGAPAGSWCSL